MSYRHLGAKSLVLVEFYDFEENGKPKFNLLV